MLKVHAVRLLLLPLLGAILSGCVSFLEPLKPEPATLGVRAATNKGLRSLPPPKEKIVAAVYKFRDQTGQYKPSSTVSSFSTAVTQGATSILLRAMEESDWFIPIEREGLSNLLNERKIIRSSRAEYLGNKANEAQEPLLPPLLFAGIILEGGIISYETNLITGGPGVKYFGVGASGQYREDRVTVYLRATSTQNGRILKTVYTSKTILSQLVDFNLYKFVDFQKLLQVEVGFSYNEPADLCVTEAIEKAVEALIIEGVSDKLWEPQDQSFSVSAVVQSYMQEKAAADRTDYFGEPQISRGAWGIGFQGGGQILNGDYPTPMAKPAVSLVLQAKLSPSFTLAASVGQGSLGTKKFFQTKTFFVDLHGVYRLLPEYRMTPFLLIGAGVVNVDERRGRVSPGQKKWYPVVVGGLGLEYMMSGNIALNALADNHIALTDKLDGIGQGQYNDYYWGGRVGLTFFFDL